MGKWAQQRKRGSAGCGIAALQPPPAPLLNNPDVDLLQHPQGSPDPGAATTLYRSPDGGAPWFAYAAGVWADPSTWGDPGVLDIGYYRATETGNGSVYAGESPPSNVFENV
jgi:hypothetical protein